MANKWDEREKAIEDEFFVKKDREQLAKLKAKQEADFKEAAKKAAYMRCPKCGESLKARSFQRSRSISALAAAAFGSMPLSWSRWPIRKRIVGPQVLAEKWLRVGVSREA